MTIFLRPMCTVEKYFTKRFDSIFLTRCLSVFIFCALFLVIPSTSSQEYKLTKVSTVSSETVRSKLVNVTIDILKKTAYVAVDAAGSYYLKGAWKYFRPAFLVLGDELRKQLPNLFDSRLTSEEARKITEEAAEILANDPKLQQFLIDQFTLLSSGQDQILIQLGVINEKVTRIDETTREILERLKRIDPIDYTPIKGMGFYQDDHGMVTFYYPLSLGKPEITYGPSGVMVQIGSDWVKGSLYEKMKAMVNFFWKDGSMMFVVAILHPDKQNLLKSNWNIFREEFHATVEDDPGLFISQETITKYENSAPPYKYYKEMKIRYLNAEGYDFGLLKVDGDVVLSAWGLVKSNEDLVEQMKYSFHSIKFNREKVFRYIEGQYH